MIKGDSNEFLLKSSEEGVKPMKSWSLPLNGSSVPLVIGSYTSFSSGRMTTGTVHTEGSPCLSNIRNPED